jgi:TPR repeat protein
MKIRWIAILSFATLCLIGPLMVRADYRGADQAAKVRDWAKVLQECQSDAQSGEKNCQSHLGYLNKSGLGVEKNLPLSIEFLPKCAAQQQMDCEEMLGDSFKNGLGVRTDYAEALRRFRLSSAKGNAWAFNNMGTMYRAGQGVTKDVAMAAQFFRSAADLGNGSAQSNLANM